MSTYQGNSPASWSGRKSSDSAPYTFYSVSPGQPFHRVDSPIGLTDAREDDNLPVQVSATMHSAEGVTLCCRPHFKSWCISTNSREIAIM